MLEAGVDERKERRSEEARDERVEAVYGVDTVAMKLLSPLPLQRCSCRSFFLAEECRRSSRSRRCVFSASGKGGALERS